MLTFAEFQEFIATTYGDKDGARGGPATFLWLTEEFGELASALQKAEGKAAGSAEIEALGREFADVLGWLTTLANMYGVDLTQAINQVYLKGNHRDHKS